MDHGTSLNFRSIHTKQIKRNSFPVQCTKMQNHDFYVQEHKWKSLCDNPVQEIFNQITNCFCALAFNLVQ